MTKDLEKISKWANQRKISFNSDSTRQVQKVVFSRKTKKQKTNHPPLLFNNVAVSHISVQKHGILVDTRLTFDDLIKEVIKKSNKTTGLIRKFQNIIPRPALVIIYKTFVRPHLVYGGIVYDKASQPTIACSKLTIETLEQSVKYVQS